MDWGASFRLAVMLVLGGAAACAGSSETAAEAACREKGFSRGTAAFAACLHPQDAEELERATEAWGRDAEGMRQ
jgi:hypothetical protein